MTQLLKRALLVLPFASAAVLNVIAILARPLGWRQEHVAGYVFSFFAPWAWLLDHDWFGRFENKHAEAIMTFAVLLWIPAALYSLCLWLLLKAFRNPNQSSS